MPRRGRRRSSKATRLFKYRTGQYTPGGKGKGFRTYRKVYRCVTTDRWECSGTTSGDTAVLMIGNYNQPLSLASQNTTFTLPGTTGTGQHPSGHSQALQFGFDKAYVISSYFKFEIAFIGDDAVENVKKDFVFWYKFSKNSTAMAVFDPIATSTKTIDFWADMRVSRGFVWKQFSATHSGGSSWPSSATVNIKIPSCGKLTRYFNAEGTTIIGRKDMTSVLSASTAQPVVKSFLHFGVFTKTATALTAGDITIDATCYQKVLLIRDFSALDDVDEVGNAT